ncbi:uncharacterized protein RHOBADRAFT_30225 [Rhodotorula graminis WP1]|uniref:Uncharacterized protein n=1 Tax=Rhodotorula graminis (strain WP1) TaxID=578459 RepID=A0A0P9EYD5_RHOGW|nr:uncharacterized protein RHOBADRAFT_30225 [Rhodotorula graminis WP1]KPV72216.1 hypothetical protein RHOBADRAFT_30225 [Rhodotorula graminis WP1]
MTSTPTSQPPTRSRATLGQTRPSCAARTRPSSSSNTSRTASAPRASYPALARRRCSGPRPSARMWRGSSLSTRRSRRTTRSCSTRCARRPLALRSRRPSRPGSAPCRPTRTSCARESLSAATSTRPSARRRRCTP